MLDQGISDLLEDRQGSVLETKADGATAAIRCGTRSAAGSVSQRACVFCGSRVVLYPIADALHLVHGPAGCAAYTWDIRGALSSGPALHRHSFTTDLRETDVVYGGRWPSWRRPCARSSPSTRPKAAFVYSTCIVGLIGDDVDAVCRRVEADCGIPVIPVDSEGFKGTKKDGYKAACAAIARLVGTSVDPAVPPAPPRSVAGINILGEFNLAGEAWMIRDTYARMGVPVVATLTGDARVDTVRRAHTACFNVVQCSGSMLGLAALLEEKYGQPYRRVSYFGLEDMAQALYDVADLFADSDPGMAARAEALVAEEMARVLPLLAPFRKDLEGARAAIYVGGAFKAHSLIKALRHLGMQHRAGGLPDRQQRGLRAPAAAVRPGHHHPGRFQPGGAEPVRAGEEGRPAHRGGQGAAHRLQAGAGLLRPQPRAQDPPGRVRGHGQLRPGSARLGHQPGMEVVRAEASMNEDAPESGMPSIPARSAPPWARAWPSRGWRAPCPCCTAPRAAPPTSGATSSAISASRWTSPPAASTRWPRCSAGGTASPAPWTT
jgi:nitrogenase molybdenum-cofactor synthesis protein NifE